MNPRKTLARKIVYMVLMAALLIPLFWLSQPSTPAHGDAKGSPGGKLAQLRDEYGLAQTQLGQIDPASETIKLASFGLRGVAANILWYKTEEYKKQKDWTHFSATLNQLIKLQPNSVKVWRYQAWNQAYNISHEFDDYRERYRYVMKGIRFLEEGLMYNKREPILVWDIGWTLSHKIGRADEHKQFRRLFKQDDDYHGSRPVADRDNWLVAKEWFNRVQKEVDAGGKMPVMPLLYRADGPKCQFSYAEAIEKEGVFGQVARREWRQAAQEWHDYGGFDLPTTSGLVVRLNDKEKYEEMVQTARKDLEALSPGLRQQIVEEKRKTLTQEQRDAEATPLEKRSGRQYQLANEAENAIFVTHDEVARRIKGENRKRAIQLAADAVASEIMVQAIEAERKIVNFAYWRLRAEIEQTKDMVDAREAFFDGERAFSQANLPVALEAYERGIGLWRKVFDKYPAFKEDQSTILDMMDSVKDYRAVLHEADKPFPKDFPLKDILDTYLQQHPEDASKFAP